ncbi:MAG: FAD binding domain-containing protein [Treponema sp.]|jgi:CO/xanthine dehydrogenase FAD-binding subunit|nr:FAD binding domain-containing protein [Treponema sp.]
MDVLHSQVFFPSGFQELFSAWGRFPDAVPFSGGTCLIRSSGFSGRGLFELPVLPKNILSLDRIDELKRITRTERYLEIGAMVSLNDIIALGKSIPEALSKTLNGIAGPQVRNLATVGGNICSIGRPFGGIDIAAPLTALDARYELRTASQSRWISALRFSSFGSSALAPQELLTRIRIPLEHWNYTICRKFHARDLGDETSGVMVFITKNEKNLLTDIRIVFAGSCLLRDKNSETFLEGRKLPLDRKDAVHYREMWRDYLSGMTKPGPLLKTKLLNCIESCLLGLAD